MSVFEKMNEEEIIGYFAQIFSDIRSAKEEVGHIIIGPQDWTHARDVYNFYALEKDKDRFEKGCCAKIWGAQIWIAPKAIGIKAYNKNQLDLLKKDFPEIAKTIEELNIE